MIGATFGAWQTGAMPRTLATNTSSPHHTGLGQGHSNAHADKNEDVGEHGDSEEGRGHLALETSTT